MTAPDRGVSVVIPTYGRPAWCVEAVRSALAQEGVDVEVLVAVDGPQPATEAALAEVLDPRLRVLVAPHGGRSAARNRALAAASRGHVAFLDDDDRYLPGGLRTLLDALARHPEAVLASGRAVATDEAGRELPGQRRKAARGRETCRDRLREQCLGRMPLNVTVAFPRRLLGHVRGFDEDVAIGEDWLFLLRAAEVGPFVDVPVPVVATRRHPGQTRHDPKTQEASLAVWLPRYFDDPRTPARAMALRRRLLARHLNWLSRNYRRVGDAAGYRRSFRAAVRADPRLLLHPKRLRRFLALALSRGSPSP